MLFATALVPCLPMPEKSLSAVVSYPRSQEGGQSDTRSPQCGYETDTLARCNYYYCNAFHTRGKTATETAGDTLPKQFE
jgi:hypothetical protein